jgi:hypothetical protein
MCDVPLFKLNLLFMKSVFTLSLLVCLVLCWGISFAQQAGQDSTGLPGDNFSLQGALDLFEKSSSPEDFEKALNTESNHVNNLDLNGDGDIDYVRVVDMMEDNVHVFVLQVPVSENENQDIAVIELEKTGDESAVIQIAGDEDIYGEEVILEPEGKDEQDGKKGAGPSINRFDEDAYIVVNVWYWPGVRFVYAPGYRPWVSPWRWKYYPTWWRPWRPVRWHVWHPYHRHYHRTYVVTHTHRIVRGPRIYRPARVTSVSVQRRHATTVNHYRVNQKKVTVTGPRGNKTTVKKTTVRGPKGKVRGSRTTVKRKRG